MNNNLYGIRKYKIGWFRNTRSGIVAVLLFLFGLITWFFKKSKTQGRYNQW